MVRHALWPVLVLSIGCASTPKLPPLVASLCPAPDLAPVTQQPCQLRDTFDALELADQLAFLSGCHGSDMELIVKERARGDRLAAHIQACEPSAPE